MRIALERLSGLVLALVLGACSQTNVHDTPQAKNEGCVTCHSAAYANVQTPPHHDDAGAPIMQDTCGDCHVTTSWTPAKGGHPPAIETPTGFPISTGSHANAAIGCYDCHKPSLGPDFTNGANCDCMNCHIGAHTAPSIDTIHAGVTNYTPSGSSALNSCWTSGCHPGG